jgi:hypothetical protein
MFKQKKKRYVLIGVSWHYLAEAVGVTSTGTARWARNPYVYLRSSQHW